MNRPNSGGSKGHKPPPPTIIPAALDDAGLDPYAFRVFARIVRRSGVDSTCWESVEEMARGCGMCERRCRLGLRLLEKLNFISGTRVRGLTTIYRPNPPAEWLTSAPDAAPPARRAARDLHMSLRTQASNASRVGTTCPQRNPRKENEKKVPPEGNNLLSITRRGNEGGTIIEDGGSIEGQNGTSKDAENREKLEALRTEFKVRQKLFAEAVEAVDRFKATHGRKPHAHELPEQHRWYLRDGILPRSRSQGETIPSIPGESLDTISPDGDR